jgi:2-polyprenyl-3-methyl-5-hydroxy-6-metoxy-1,4-benzoquinol methylase
VTSATWQLGLDAARRYEDVLVRAILGPFARALVDALSPRSGEVVVDVGCGTGAAARRAAELVGPSGAVVAADVNAAMLEVARSLPAAAGAAIEWSESPAERLACADAGADVVVCAQVLQFVQDRALALREMRRVARRGARIGVGVWCALEENPYFAAVEESLARHLGSDAAGGLRAAFALADGEELLEIFAGAGLERPTVSIHQIELALPLPDVFVPQHVAATPVAAAFEAAPEPVRAEIAAAAGARLAPFSDGTGLRVPFRSWFALASR